ncbi:ATP-binding protein [Sphingomonas yantingensis]|uniref:histidine kinase n=1 Tax=Sphingomonas yantingensis TaxID=1241761 RepID=A0A7W9EJM6_9SPHN|nr:ATP-binding protein [Sphingomonas yantingensis]MBB5698776.1 two-component system phosphate regulon sensor histidine kinase PhoR [Sphingomonas yantingensis]
MGSDRAIRAGIALALAVASGAAALLIGGDVSATLVAIVGAIAAVLVALGTESDERPVAAPTPAPAPDALVSDVIEAVVEPVLVVADRRVVRANTAARALLGQHILGEDVRLAIRHPAAAERLIAPLPEDEAPIDLVGVGTREQRWEMHVRAAGPSLRVVHLIDRTGSYAADKIRIDFVANASHELRTPLASILGFIETLREGAGDDPDTRDRFLKIMFGEATRMRRLVDDLMSLSRIEAEKYREPDQIVRLGELVEEVRAEVTSIADARAADLVTAIADAPPIKGDRAQLSQVLHNLVGNAMKYGRPGTPVTVELRHDGGAMLRLSVRDEGDGIAAEHLPRLTERFYRVDSGRSRQAGGTGLGLSIVKHIVERHRGRLDIASAPGRGTTVTVLLPVVAA